MTTADGSRTFLELLIATIDRASEYNSQDQTPPVAVLWPDKDRQWEPLIPALRNPSSVFSLGKYSPDENTGPAYWLRCIVARTIPHPSLVPGKVPVIYLPGYSRRDLSVMESCPGRTGTAGGTSVPGNSLDAEKRQRLDHKCLPPKHGQGTGDSSQVRCVDQGGAAAIPHQDGGGVNGNPA